MTCPHTDLLACLQVSGVKLKHEEVLTTGCKLMHICVHLCVDVLYGNILSITFGPYGACVLS